jgi:glyoxylase-like metal-dependent hydrolase (beta-lactamase superfamily II)
MAAALVVAVLATHQSAAQTPPPLIKPEGLRQVSAHVHVIPDNSVPMVPNVGIIVGEQAVLVVDTGLGPPNGATVLNVAQKLGGSRALYVVGTHMPPQHDLGAQACPATAKRIRSLKRSAEGYR